VTANATERRGEALFFRPLAHDPSLSCAGCHVPSSAFVDHRQHDVGSGGLFKTPTLRNADVNAPYFHDGRFDDYRQVVAHFDRVFELGLSPEEQRIWWPISPSWAIACGLMSATARSSG